MHARFLVEPEAFWREQAQRLDWMKPFTIVQDVEAAVVAMPHDVKGQGIYAFVTLNTGVTEDETLRSEVRSWVRREIGPTATPDVVQFAPALPKTRSGKIMRRILRKIAAGELGALGDTSTLADPAVVHNLISRRTTSEAGN